MGKGEEGESGERRREGEWGMGKRGRVAKGEEGGVGGEKEEEEGGEKEDEGTIGTYIRYILLQTRK